MNCITKVEYRENINKVIASRWLLLLPKGTLNKVLPEPIEEVVTVSYILASEYDTPMYMINERYIISVCEGDASYVCTAEEWEKKEISYGKYALLIARASHTPWHIACIAAEMGTFKAVSYLCRLRRICRERKIEPWIREILLESDKEARIEAIHQFFGNDILISGKYIERPNIVRYLAYYILHRGQPVKDIDKVCNIKKCHMQQSDSIHHLQLMRALEFKVPVSIAGVVNYLSDDEEVYSVLKTLKRVAESGNIDDANLLSEIDDIRHSAIIKALGTDIWSEHFYRKIAHDPVLTKKLGLYLLNDGKVYNPPTVLKKEEKVENTIN